MMAANVATTRRRRRKRHTDNTNYAAMLARMIRAHGRRVAFGDERDLAELIELRDVLDDTITEAVQSLVYVQRFPWSTIAQATGHTRQNAHKLWGRHR